MKLQRSDLRKLIAEMVKTVAEQEAATQQKLLPSLVLPSVKPQTPKNSVMPVRPEEEQFYTSLGIALMSANSAFKKNQKGERGSEQNIKSCISDLNAAIEAINNWTKT